VRGAPVGQFALAQLAMSTPPISMVPPLGWSMPAIRFSSVLLPEPLGPIRAMNSPRVDVEVDALQHRE
jgi:hypothetical protein